MEDLDVATLTIQDIKENMEEQRKEAREKVEENITQKRKEQLKKDKEEFFNYISKAKLFNVFFKDIKTVDDIQNDSVLYYVCFYYLNIKDLLINKLHKDIAEFFDTILNTIYNNNVKHFTISIPSDEDYKVHFVLPRGNDVKKAALLNEYQQNIQLNAITLYTASNQETLNSSLIIDNLTAIDEICYLTYKIGDNVVKAEWNSFNQEYINIPRFALCIYAMISLIYADDFKKKIRF